jgi:hypothetical protein
MFFKRKIFHFEMSIQLFEHKNFRNNHLQSIRKHVFFLRNKTQGKMKTLRIVFLGILATVIASCTKSEPAPNPNTNGGGGGGTVTVNQSLCNGDSICEFPFYVMPLFVPGGYYLGADNGASNGCATTVEFGLDTAETPTFENQNVGIFWTYNSSRTWWGANFNNGQNWDPIFKVKAGATTLKFDIRHSKVCKVTINAFNSAAVGQYVSNRTTAVTPEWESIEITLTNPPSTFVAPLSIILEDYVGNNGDVIEVNLRNIRIE